MDMVKREYAEKLLRYIDAAPMPYQSVDELEKMLVSAGAAELREDEKWSLEKGKLYYLKKNGTQLAAFRISGEPSEDGFRIGAAHHDAPGFRIKTAPSSVDFGYERLILEGYGGLIVHGWLDRPLSVAGRVYVKADNAEGSRAVNVNIKKPVVQIPSAAIHVVNDVNNGAKFNIQTEMCPFFAQSDDGKTRFTEFLAEYIGVSADDILSYELGLYEAAPSCFVGLDDEFISAPRLDDASLAYCTIAGLCESEDSGANDIALIFDHEEIGSRSDRGAMSNTLLQIVDRICEKLGYSAEDKYRAFAKSTVFSADMAHASHPSYLSKAEPNLPVKLNKGPVLKMATGQSYATSPRGTAFFKTLCERADIPYQQFNNRSDARGGGTIGPIISYEYGLSVVDIGNPMLAMHSVREFGGSEDVYYMIKLFRAFFESFESKEETK